MNYFVFVFLYSVCGRGERRDHSQADVAARGRDGRSVVGGGTQVGRRVRVAQRAAYTRLLSVALSSDRLRSHVRQVRHVPVACVHDAHRHNR